ncbi:MAG: SUMF1/EgtB/PvdO family nonheme iron enzyme [Bacteroidia bacterium]
MAGSLPWQLMDKENPKRGSFQYDKEGENTATPRRNHLLVIGIDEYAHLKPLNNAVLDAKEVARVLTSDYFFDIPDFAPPLYNKDATRSNLIKTFDKLAYKFGEKKYQDNLIIYFAGHGEYKESLSAGYWALHEAKYNDLSTYFSNAELVSYIKAIHSHHTLIVTDSCFSGSLVDEAERRSNGLENKRSRCVLASGLKDESSSDGPSGEHSPFARAILKFLAEKRGNSFQIWPLKEYIREYFVDEKISQTPIFAPLDLRDHKNGDFFIYPRRNLLHDLEKLIEAGNPEDLERFIEDYTIELRKHKKLSYAHETLETLFWNRLQEKPDGETCLAFLSRYLHSKSGRPEAVLKLLENWIEQQAEEKSEISEDLILWQNRLRKAETEKDAQSREVAQMSKKLKKAESEAEESAITLDIKTQEWEDSRKELIQKTATLSAQWEKERKTFIEKIASLEKQLVGAQKQFPSPHIEVKGQKISLPEMILIKVGSFSREKYKVTVSDFWLGKTAVTFEQYDGFCEMTKREKPSDEGWGRGLRPVINVSWNDAKAYCDWLSEQTGQNWRLPTEAEWEYAAGGGSSGRTIYAGTDDERKLGEYAWYSANANSQTHPVGQKKPNPLGLYDMSGNVWEWCSDWYGNYPSSDISDPTGPSSGSYRVFRGGSCSGDAAYCRVAFRNFAAPVFRFGYLGFRPTRTN